MSIAGPSGNICWPGRATKAVLIPAHAAPATSQPCAATSRHSDTSAPTRPAAQRYTSACGLYFPTSSTLSSASKNFVSPACFIWSATAAFEEFVSVNQPVVGVPQAFERRDHVGVRRQRPHRGDGFLRSILGQLDAVVLGDHAQARRPDLAEVEVVVGHGRHERILEERREPQRVQAPGDRRGPCRRSPSRASGRAASRSRRTG